MSSEAAAKLEHFRIDAAASTFTAQAFAEGLFSAFGHDPIIGIKEFEGHAEFVAGTFANASLKITVRADSLAVVNDVKEKDRHEIERMMREEVLETGQYPEIVFESNNIVLSRSGKDRYRARVIGELALHGVTQKNLWLNGEVVMIPEGLRVTGDFAVKQKDFNIKLVSVAGGTLKIKNEVKCSFEILARNAS